MHSFKEMEKWKHKYVDAPGGGRLVNAKGGRFDRFFETGNRLRELPKVREHHSEQLSEVGGNEVVKALVRAFNIHNYARNTVETNFTLQTRKKGNCIVVSFDKGMTGDQCVEYLSNIKKKIICEFFKIEEYTNEEILDAAKLIFDIKSFPFHLNERGWSVDKYGRMEFAVPIDQGIIFNLKSHLAFSLKKDVLEDMKMDSTTVAFDKKNYLWRDEFPNQASCKQFLRIFSSRMKQRYENVPRSPLRISGNNVYIKDVFNDARFIESIVRRTTWLGGIYLGFKDNDHDRTKLFKEMIIKSIYRSTGIVLDGFICVSPLDRTQSTILIPTIRDNGRVRVLTNEEAFKINCAFGSALFDNVNGKNQAEISVDGSDAIYGMDFSNPEISDCVVNSIIESAAINKDHQLTIDPDLRLKAVSHDVAEADDKDALGPSGHKPSSEVKFADVKQHSPEKGLLGMVRN